MVLSVPRYPEFDGLHWSEQETFYVPELEMSFGEVCGAMRKCWIGYKCAHRQADEDMQMHYADIIQGIIEALGYRPMVFQIVGNVDAWDAVDPEAMIKQGAMAEVQDIEEKIQKRRALALEYGRAFKQDRFEWNNLANKYVKYTSPEDVEDDGYFLEMQDAVDGADL